MEPRWNPMFGRLGLACKGGDQRYPGVISGDHLEVESRHEIEGEFEFCANTTVSRVTEYPARGRLRPLWQTKRHNAINAKHVPSILQRLEKVRSAPVVQVCHFAS